MADTYQRSKELWKSACNTSERDFERRQIQEETMEKADESCPGSKIRSEGKGLGLGTGQGKGPIGVPVGKKIEEEEKKVEKAEGASKGRGDEREKAGDKLESGEKRAELLDTSKIPAENKKEIAPTEGDAKEKKNPTGKADAATAGQGDERDKAGSTKEAGEKRAVVEKAVECSPEEMAKRANKEKITKAFDEDAKLCYVIEKSSVMKYFYPEQVALMKSLVNRKIDAIATELGLDKALVKEVVTELIKAFPKKFLEKQEEKKEEEKK